MSLRLILVAVLAFLSSVACTGRPVPMAAHQGSTIAIALRADTLQLSGFASEVFSDDPLRGQWHVYLCPSGETHCAQDPNRTLDLTYVTSITASRASQAGVDNLLVNGQWDVNVVGQQVALVRIPENMDPGIYSLVIRFERVDGSFENALPLASNFEVLAA